MNKQIFSKAYLPNWSRAIEEVESVRRTIPIQYTLKNSPQNKVYYEWQLQKVPPKSRVKDDGADDGDDNEVRTTDEFRRVPEYNDDDDDEKIKYELVKTELSPLTVTRSGKVRSFSKNFVLKIIPRKRAEGGDDQKRTTETELTTVDENEYERLKKNGSIYLNSSVKQ